MRVTLLCAVLCFACAACQKKSSELDDLQRQAAATQAEYQPKVDALVARLRVLKRDVRGNLPDWQMNVRTAQLADDRLGLEPFEQVVPPGPGWKPAPGSLLGMGPYVQQRAAELASQGKLEELRFLVDDERKRYASGVADVDEWLTRVETWLAAAQTAAGSATR